MAVLAELQIVFKYTGKFSLLWMLWQWGLYQTLFNQIPADVTHIRLASGMQKDQLDILGLIGNVKIKILNGTSAHDRT